MGTAEEKLKIIYEAEDRGAGQTASGLHTALLGLGKFLAGGALVVGGAALAGMGAGLKTSMDEAIEAEEVMASFMQTLKSTGREGEISVEMADKLANGLMQVTKFSDEEILSAETMLLRFKNINADAFPRALGLSLDLAQAMGTDAATAAQQLGKSLLEPGEGMRVLKAAGVTLSEEEKKMIEQMVATGDSAGALDLIFGKLEKGIGGAAQAAGETFSGQMTIAKNTLLNVAEGIGNVLLPAFAETAKEITPLLMELANGIAEFVKSDQFKKWLADTVKWIKEDLIPGIRQAAVWFKNDFIPAVKAIWSVAGPILKFLAAAFHFLWAVEIKGLVTFFNNQKNAIIGFFALFEKAKTTVETAIKNIKAAITGVSWKDLGKSIIQGIADGVGAFAGLLWDAAVQAATGALAAIKKVLGIKSPSKVFEDEVGANIGLGMLAGIKKTLSGVALQTSVSPFLSAGRSFAGAGAGGYAGGGSVVVNLNAPVLGFRDERDLADKLGPLIEKYLRGRR